MNSVNWDGVRQSIFDFWLPTAGWITGIIVVLILIYVIRKKLKSINNK